MNKDYQLAQLHEARPNCLYAHTSDLRDENYYSAALLYQRPFDIVPRQFWGIGSDY